MTVHVPDHPWFDNGVMEPAPDLFDRLAGELDGDGMPAFLFGAVPVAVFGELLSKDPARLGPPLSQYLWLMHLSGYFGGVWLRDQISRALPDAPLLGVSITPDEAAFTALVDTIAGSLAAARSDDAEVLAYIDAHFDAHVDGYGYNRGYLLEILETPPQGLTSPEGFLRVQGPLGAQYSVPELPGLDDLRSRFGAAASVNGALVERIEVIEAAADARGRAVWSTGLSVQGFPQSEYEQLLELSAFFLMATQAVALNDALALADADADPGRVACRVAAALAPWTQSYMMGLLDGRDDRRLPSFA